jgi:hypothetical protein
MEATVTPLTFGRDIHTGLVRGWDVIRSAPLVTACAAVCLLGLVWPATGFHAYPGVALPLAFLALTFAPGHLLSRALRLGRTAFVFECGIDATLGLALSLLAATLVARRLLPIDLVPTLVGLVGLASFAVICLRPSPASTASRRRTVPNLGVALLAAVSVALVFVQTARANQDFPLYADRWAYLRFITQFSTDDLHVSDPYQEGEDVQARMKFPGWLVFQAELSRLGNLDPNGVYSDFLPYPLVLLAFLGLATHARQLFGGERAELEQPPGSRTPSVGGLLGPGAAITAALSVVVLTALRFGTSMNLAAPGYHFTARLVEDKFFLWFVLMPAAFVLSLRAFADPGETARTGEGRRSFLAAWLAAALLIAAIAVTHPLGLFQYAVYFGGFAIAEFIALRRRSYLARGAALALVVAACALVPLSQRADTSSERLDVEQRIETGSPLDQRRLLVIPGSDELFMSSPRLIFNPVMIAGLVVVVPLLWRLRRSRPARFAVVASLLPALLVLTPVTAPLTARLISIGMLWRVLWLIPSAFALVVAAIELTRPILARLQSDVTGDDWFRYAAPPAGLALAALAFLPLMRSQVERLDEVKGSTVLPAEQTLLDAAPAIFAPGSGLLTPPAFNGDPAYAPFGYELTFRLSAVVSNVYGLTYRRRYLDDQSLAAQRRFYTGSALQPDKLQTLAHYGLRYVVFFRNDDAARVAKESVEGLAVFRLVYADAAYEVYEVRQPAVLALLAGPEGLRPQRDSRASAR